MSIHAGRICEICGGGVHTNTSGRQYDADGNEVKNVEVEECCKCGTGTTTPKPSMRSLNRLYSEGVYKNEGGRASFFVSLVLDWLQRTRIREIERYSRKQGRLLDIGCGKGRFVTVASRKGWDAMGQDFSCSQAGFATRRSGINVWCGGLGEFPEDRKFDVVTAWHVLEHTPDPKEVILTMKSLMEKNGIIAIEVPNYKSWQSHIGKGGWFQSDVPRHLWHFTPEGLERLITDGGFRVLEFHTFSAELGIFGMLQTLLNAIGFEPQWLFRYLKRTSKTTNLFKIFITLIQLASATDGLMPKNT